MNGKKQKKLTPSQQRAAWKAKGLCGIDGKDPVWNVKSAIRTPFGVVLPGKKTECKKHVLYFKEWAFNNRAAEAKPKSKRKGRPARKPVATEGIPLQISTAAIAKEITEATGRTTFIPPQPRTELFNKVVKAVGGDEVKAAAVMTALGALTITTPMSGEELLGKIDESVRTGLTRSIGFRPATQPYGKP